jgi:AraC family transcriptional activator of pobA
MAKPIKIHAPADFVNSFLAAISAGFPYQKFPLQIHLLESMLPHLKVPVPLHRTTFNYLVIQTEGQSLQQVDTALVEVQPHDVLLIRQGHLISIQSVDRAAKGFFILFENEALAFLSKAIESLSILEAEPLIRLSLEDSHWVQEICCLLHTQVQQPTKATPDICLHLFAALLHKITAYSKLASNRLERATEVAFQFKRLVFAQAIQEKTIHYYASQLHISDNYLNRCVKGATGKAPKDWIIEVCLLQSKILLQNTFADVAEVAFQVGFTDPSYFGRLFKKKFGQTPTAFQMTQAQELS